MLEVKYLVSLTLFLLIFPKLKYLFKSKACLWDSKLLNWFQTCSFGGVLDFARFWNQYEVHGLEKVKNMNGNCLLVGYHSRCTLDLVYVLVSIQPAVIATHLMFKIPFMRWVLAQANILPSGTDEHAEMGFIKALCGKRPVLLLPGGVYECLKPINEIGRIQWKELPGFARIIHKEKELLGNRTKVFPFYTKNCEQSFYRNDFIYEGCGKWSCYMYDLFRKGHIWFMPIMLTFMFISIGFKILPRPVKLDTYIGDAVVLKEGESAEDFGLRVAEATQSLVDKVEALPQIETVYCKLRRSTDPADRVQLAILSIQMVLVGIYTVIQNVFIFLGVILSIWAPVMVALYAIIYAAPLRQSLS